MRRALEKNYIAFEDNSNFLKSIATFVLSKQKYPSGEVSARAMLRKVTSLRSLQPQNGYMDGFFKNQDRTH